MSLYQPFLDYALALMQQRLSLEPYPIPKGFERKEALTKQGKREELVITTSHAFKSPKLRQIRAAHVQGGKGLQVLNFVIFPELNYDLPFFGADLVTLPGGHLIALDMQPLFHDATYKKKYSDPILPIFQSYKEDLPWGGDFPEEAKPFFSPAFLWSRPQETEIVETKVLEAFKDYLKAYLDLVEQAEFVTDNQRLEEIKNAQLRYIGYRAEKDPARGMFTRLYGQDWTEEYIHGFLFDLERQLTRQQ
ncbi:phycoerythrobilin:ferredoxin oxidoreductase [Aetokthonos hydrillicola Thurmond2011]|jgi:phycoerythrobilin:ferredoxin oxidoreductase|uniref:Phycoerythrobilin:ferredoxin oxidoreductase n=1 Tax=Aetokthonos hydrillicola Thurmond2011 TaxID=2712845 RepID=A0AAP5IG78_9CYAN|nr:phycoerythrobilin:ferredoxin oxidoreductase [Aetokthonos hydrillicola]MBO3458023.1 phycoerythrobilin:ferredoxin oxidoreductase [Aetokthonos hydrillicola CCALA 1050]MBW4587143.1 phycoerythrobilin:ferredoxin oxidoreductase [Aetokthonos hydrillicola CCALA 1050]MDR9899607.1 phycoerythrobilin:ferredoxin oxidoreductase [Aetokthonos hydrillicola Thurmond2011]